MERAGVTLRGDSPRGALNAAYWLLDQAGFVWTQPGPTGLARRPVNELPEGTFRQEPSFSRRTVILGQDALHDEWPAWMEWASRNRLNDIFFHDTPPSRLDRGEHMRPATAEGIADDGAGWLVERWDADGPAIRQAAAQRGMTLQFGGHYLPMLLPRARFAEHPEWFPLRDGVRDGRYNLCTSSQEARTELVRGARAFFERFAGASVYHAWADDIRGGGWCACPDCARLSPSDQALIATNLLADALAALEPHARIAHLAYHDTVQPPSATRPQPNVTMLWAPRERCYAHGIDDERCFRNSQQYWPAYSGLLPLFDNDSERVQLFEYYSDAILFKGLGPPHLLTLPADARAYSSGAENMQNLMVGNRPWVGAPWHAWWMARVSWDANADPVEGLHDFCGAAFPDNAPAMVAYYRQQERAYRLLLDLHDLEPVARHDVLDFSDRPRRTLSAKAPEALEAALILASAARSLASLAETNPAAQARLDGERSQAAAVAAMSAHLGNRVAAWDAVLDGLRPLAQSYLGAARDALSRYEAWDAEHNVPAYANISRNMLRAMHYHTGRILQFIDP